MSSIAIAKMERPPRRRVFKGAKIVFRNRNASIECTLRDLSQGGASLMVASTIGIPDFFDLRSLASLRGNAG
jgi:hypothetical protein